MSVTTDMAVQGVARDALKLAGAVKAPRILSGECPEPVPGSLLEMDEGDMFHYGVYLSHGYILDTVGVADDGVTGTVVVRTISHPWRDTRFRINCSVEELLTRVPAKVDYDLFVNNCWGMWKEWIPSLPDWYERERVLQTCGPFHVPHQPWVDPNGKFLEQDYDCKHNTHTMLVIVKSCLRFLSKVSLKVLTKVKPLVLYHLLATTRPTFGGVLATFARLLELYEVPLMDNILSFATLESGTRGWREGLNMLITGFGVVASFFCKKPLDWLNGALKRLTSALKGSEDLATAANKVANVAKVLLPGILEDHWDADAAAATTLEEILHDSCAAELADPATRQMAITLAQKTVSNLKKYQVLVTGDEGAIKRALQRAEAALARLVLNQEDMTPRAQPYVLVLAGPPGCGKTTLATAIARAAAETLGGGVFQLNSDIDHWDSYTNQPVVCWEDFGAADHQADCRLLQKLADTAPLTLNCDKLENKGRAFTSRLIVITTNWQRLVPPEYAHPDAVLRRVTRHIYVRSQALEEWCRKGRVGPPPVAPDWSHQTLVGLPPMSVDWKGTTIYGRAQPLRIDYGAIVRPLMKAVLEGTRYLDLTGAMRELNLNMFQGMRLLAQLKLGMKPPIPYTGQPFRLNSHGYHIEVFSNNGKADYRNITETTTSPTDQLLAEIQAELDHQDLTGTKRPDINFLRKEAGQRSTTSVQDLLTITITNMEVNWRTLVRLACQGLNFLFGVVAVTDTNTTASDLALVRTLGFEAKGKTKRGRGQKHHVRGGPRYRFSQAEYDDFLARRADAKRRGVVYTVEDYLDDIGAYEGDDVYNYTGEEPGFQAPSRAPPRLLDEGKNHVGWAIVDGERLVTPTHVAKAAHWVWKGEKTFPVQLRGAAGEYAEIDAGPLRGKPLEWVAEVEPHSLAHLWVDRDGKPERVIGRVLSTADVLVEGSRVAGVRIKVVTGETRAGDCGRPWVQVDACGVERVLALHTASLPGLGIAFGQRKVQFEATRKPPPPNLVRSHPLADGTHLWLTPYGKVAERRSGPPALGKNDPRNPTPLLTLALTGLEPFLGPDTSREPQCAAVVTVQVLLKLRSLVGRLDPWDDETAFASLDQTTSSGYPNYTNKDPTRAHIQATRARVEDFMQGKGELHPPVYTAALKDEPYLLEKVAAGKRRLLFCSPFETTMACARVFGPVTEALKSVRLRWPGCVGVKPAVEWAFLVHHLEMDGTLTYCADYSRWDSTLPRWLLKRALWVMTKLSTFSRAHEFVDFLSQPRWVICGARKFLVEKGLPSGIPMTSILNCVAHWIASAISLTNCGYDPSEAIRVPLLVYGDDEVIALKPELSAAYFDHMRALGFCPTGPDKGPTIHGVKATAMEFLSRRTRWEGGTYVGALKEESIRRQLHLTRDPKHTDPTEVRLPHAEYVTQLHCALGEASLHGRKFFHAFCDEVAEAVRLSDIDFDFWTFQAYFDWMQSEAMELEGAKDSSTPVPAGATLAENPTPAPLPENTAGLALAPTINPIDPYILETFVEVPGGVFTIGPDTTTNQVLLELPVGPGLNMYLNHLWMMYAGWSGGFEIQIQVAGNAFISGKIIFAVVPPGVHLPTNSTAASGYPHVILDLRVADSIHLQVPDVKNISYHLHGEQGKNARLVAMAYTQMRATAPTAEFQVEVRMLSRPLADFAFTMVVPPEQEAALTVWSLPTRPVALMTNPRFPVGPIKALVADPAVTQVYQQLGRYSFEEGGPLGCSTLGPAQSWPFVGVYHASSQSIETMTGPEFDDPFIIGAQPTSLGRCDFGGSFRALVAEYNPTDGTIGRGSLGNFVAQTDYGPGVRIGLSLESISDGSHVVVQVMASNAATNNELNTSPRPIWDWPDPVAPIVTPNPAETLLMFHSGIPGADNRTVREVSCLLPSELFASFLETRDTWQPGNCALVSYTLDGLPLFEAKIYSSGFMTVPATTVVRRWDSGGYFTFLRWVNWNYVMTPLRGAAAARWL
ncbi:polyprotein [Calicivirus pig/AB104/CAN]|nr:polyprotein [Calicivirus pig/AB104/CAN]